MLFVYALAIFGVLGALSGFIFVKETWAGIALGYALGAFSPKLQKFLLSGSSWEEYGAWCDHAFIVSFILTIVWLLTGDPRRKARKWATERFKAFLAKVRDALAPTPPRPPPAPA